MREEIISFNTKSSVIAKNALLGFLLQALLKFKGVIILPIIVHFLSREVIGEWRIITASVAILLPIISLNLFDGSGMFFSSDLDKKSVRNKYYTVFNTALILEAFSAILFCVFGVFYKGEFSGIVLPVFLYFVTMYNYKMGIMLLQTYQKSKRLMIINLIAEYGGVALSLVLLALGVRSVMVFLIPPIAIYTIVFIYMFICINHEIPYCLSIDFGFLKKTLPISLSLMPVFLAEWVLASIGIFAIKHFAGTAEVGSFSVLTSLASLVLSLRATLQFFWFSTCSNVMKTDYDKFLKIFSVVVKAYLFILALLVVLYGLLSRELILILANEEYLPIRKDLFFFVLGNCLMVFSCIWNGMMYAKGESLKILSSYLTASLVTALLSWFGAKYVGITGACVAYFIGETVLFVMMFCLNGMTPEWTRRDKIFLLVILSAMAFSTVMVFIPFPNWLRYVVAAVLTGGLLVCNDLTGFIPVRKFLEIFKKQ